jgi:hypothetical protein
MDKVPTEIFMKYVLDKSESKIFDIANQEWEYIGQVKHLNGVQSTAKTELKLNKYSIAFYNFKTNQILHTNTDNQYFLHCKGKDREKITQTNPLGDGSSQDMNMKMLNKISTFVTSVEQKHLVNGVSLDDIKKLCKYRYFLKNINILEKDKLEEVLNKINYLVTNFYNINYCCKCNDFYLSKFKQSEFRPKCDTCYKKGPEKCLLKMKK